MIIDNTILEIDLNKILLNCKLEKEAFIMKTSVQGCHACASKIQTYTSKKVVVFSTDESNSESSCMEGNNSNFKILKINITSSQASWRGFIVGLWIAVVQIQWPRQSALDLDGLHPLASIHFSDLVYTTTLLHGIQRRWDNCLSWSPHLASNNLDKICWFYPSWV